MKGANDDVVEDGFLKWAPIQLVLTLAEIHSKWWIYLQSTERESTNLANATL